MKRTLRELELAGKRVFIRADFNVPLKDGRITDDTRIQASLPTIRHALDHGATVVLASHLGRPKGAPDPKYSLRPVADRLSALLERPVGFADDCIGEAAREAIARAGAGGIVLLENLRFHAGEERNDAGFAKALAELADVYVNDAFGTAHRAHASTEGIARQIETRAAGLLMARELDHLGRVLETPDRPFVAILGGAKVSGKLEVIENLIGRIDALAIGGAMAYTFFKSRGLPVGRSLVEDELLDAARGLTERASALGVRLELPADHVVAARPEADTAHDTLPVTDAAIGDRMGVDIGPETIRQYSALIERARTIVWNGPMGVFEVDAFARGTTAIARAVADSSATSVVGGGDSIAALAKAGVTDRITHVSTGGGASLEFLAGRTLPGVAVMSDA